MLRPAAPAFQKYTEYVSIWSNNDLKVGLPVFFFVGVKAQLKGNKTERVMIILWEAETRINLFLKEPEE